MKLVDFVQVTEMAFKKASQPIEPPRYVESDVFIFLVMKHSVTVHPPYTLVGEGFKLHTNIDDAGDGREVGKDSGKREANKDRP